MKYIEGDKVFVLPLRGYPVPVEGEVLLAVGKWGVIARPYPLGRVTGYEVEVKGMGWPSLYVFLEEELELWRH